MKTRRPSFDHEKKFWDKNLKILGIDEVGRGSFAGPLIGAAVSFDNNLKKLKKKKLKQINDSKLLTHKKRKALAKFIQTNSEYLIETVDIETIDRIGIGKSNSLLFRRLIKKAQNRQKNLRFLIDGRRNLKGKNAEFIIKGDRESISIAAASIIAKVIRDRIMVEYDRCYPGYGFARHKGYGTPEHFTALRTLGPCPIHRRSFRMPSPIPGESLD